ncbi:MAG: ABC transporter substrate-binding protein [Planctomycetes bacterium]|nr:ABC transporter substrate-binding protein [Planctomycetota bacterium]
MSIDFFRANGFPQFDDLDKLKTFGSSITLSQALKLKGLNEDVFLEQLTSIIEESCNGNLDDNEQALHLVGLLPCPVRIPLLEQFESFLAEKESSLKVNHELKAASTGADWIANNIHEAQHENDLPDIFISAGFETFFDKEKGFGRFREKAFYNSLNYPEVNKSFQGISLMDPEDIYSMIAVVPSIFMVNEKVLGDTPMPKTWQDLLKPEFENKLSLPVGDFDLFNGILLNIRNKYGDSAVEALGKGLMKSMHPSEMVKSERKANPPAVTIMPYFFSKMTRPNSGMKMIWPEDGSIISPIFLLANKKRQQEVQILSDFFASKEVGETLAINGLFPSTNPEVENVLPENHPFMWLGWDYIYSHNLSDEIETCLNLFNHKGQNQ